MISHFFTVPSFLQSVIGFKAAAGLIFKSPVFGEREM